MLLPSGNPFECHEEVLSLQPMIPPTKRFDIFPLCGMLRRSRCGRVPIMKRGFWFKMFSNPTTSITSSMLASVLCVCFLPIHFWTSSSLDVPAGVTQEEGHTGFFIHLLSAVRALIFIARRIQPFLSLVDREVEFCVLTI